MASTHNVSPSNPVMYIGISVLVVLFAATLDSCSSSDKDDKAAAAPAATEVVAKEPTFAEKAPATAAAYEENIKPIGTVVIAEAPAVAVVRSGEEVFQSACTACHTAGVLGAPKLDKADWEPRVAKGLEGLVHNAVNGINSMPPRGGNPAITDEEITKSILYMTEKAGITLAAAPAEAAPAQAAAAAPAQEAAPAQAAAAPAQEATPAQAAAAAPAQQAGRSGEDVYNTACVACHAAGVLGAPKLDKADWEPRIAKGLDGLLHNAINGINSMPPRGGNPAITDAELSHAIVYMTGKAGIDLAPAAPEAPAVQAAPEAPTAPVAQAAPEAPTAPAAPAAVNSGINGETVYRSICFSCHDVGIANSPMIGDKAAWAPRIATGIDMLYVSTVNGKGVMPAKGGNPTLSDAQVKAAVDWMVSQAQ